MKLIHTADLHLDARSNAHLSAEKAKERRDEMLRTFTRMVEYAAENDVKAILISGDLFDRKSVSRLAENTVKNEMASHPGIMFFYLRGNHDAAELFPEGEAPDNVKLFSGEWTTYALSSCVTVTGAELFSADASLYDRLSLDPENVNILMLHGQESETKGKADTEIIRMASLRNRFIDYLALGHIHKFRREELDRRGVYVYPGCPEGHGYDECGPKGFVLIDVDEEERTLDFRFVPFSFREIHELKVDVTGASGTPEIVSRVRETPGMDEISPRDLVKVTLTGALDAETEKDTTYLENAFKDRFYAFYVKDETTTTVDFERYRLDKSLKGEFVRAVSKEDWPEEEKTRVIRAGLAALAGEPLS